ncbi:MAG: F0F1 ATP synthase subunit delta [Chromatiales bacterium]|jgi:F-type H+-transporting ATPase subunit b
MQIDWITVSAQIVNFLVLVYLLKRFLYGPVVAAMDRREARIAGRLDEARQREEAAERAARDYRDRCEELEQQRRERLEAVRREADEERRRLIAEAREDAERRREQWRQELERERAEVLDRARRAIALSAAEVAERTLRDLAGQRIESRVVERFIERLRSMDSEEREALKSGGEERIRVLTALESSEEDAARIRQALDDLVPGHGEVAIEQDPDLICGIVLRLGDCKLDWSVHRYLETLEQRVEQALTERGGD